MAATVAYALLPIWFDEALALPPVFAGACAVVETFAALRILEISFSPSTRTNAMPLYQIAET
jgi:hypothetical protein